MRYAALIALLIVLPPATALAELSGVDSLELMVAESTAVVHASVGEGGTFHVIKTIKGEPRQSIRPESSEAALRDVTAGDHVLLFLDGDGTLLRSPRQTGLIRLTGPQRAVVFDVHWHALTDEEEIVRVATEAASWPRPAKTISIAEPFTMALKMASYVRFPVNARLEQAAREWPPLTHAPQIAQALREFRSPENAAILRRLLDDRTECTVEGSGRLLRVSYVVPDLAWHALEAWGEHPPRPVMTLPDDYYQPLRWYLMVFAFAIVLAPVGIAFIVVAKRKLLAAVAVLFGTLTLLMIVSWARSDDVVDELFIDRSDHQLWISSAGGWIVVTRIPNWHGRMVRDRYVPMGEQLDGLAASEMDTLMPHLQPPRGWMIGAIPFKQLQQLWFGPPTRVIRDDDWHIARVVSGVDAAAAGLGNPPFMVQRFQVRWVVLIATFGTWPAAWIGIGVYRELRTRRRRTRGLCIGCGYDLRGSGEGGRCPECGLAFSS